jgi:hypothetical protein
MAIDPEIEARLDWLDKAVILLASVPGTPTLPPRPTGGAGNVIAADPLLDALTPTAPPVHVPQAGSPAVDQIVVGVFGCGTTDVTDQRGDPRPAGVACDIGAIERP